jgi:hypothetical protein
MKADLDRGVNPHARQGAKNLRNFSPPPEFNLLK